MSEENESVTVEDEALHKDVVPLLYVEVVAQKRDSTAAVKRLVAKVRDDHGDVPDKYVYDFIQIAGRSSWRQKWRSFARATVFGEQRQRATIRRPTDLVKQLSAG